MDRRNLLAGLSLGGFAAAALAASTDEAEAARTGRQLIEQFAATLSAHNIDAFAALISDTYVNHQMSAAAPAAPSGMTPKQASVAFFAGRLKGLPDLKVTIEASVTNHNMVAASFVYEGTQTGTYLGVPPTGKHLRFTSCDIYRVVNGQLAEHWGMGDIAGIMAQMKG
jgi:steroid delta-isomerase-like uncharacterized protein